MKHQTSTSQNSTNPLLWVVAPALLFQVGMNARGLHCMSEGFVKLRQGQCSSVGFGAITHNVLQLAEVREYEEQIFNLTTKL